jgi:hypothetical protein
MPWHRSHPCVPCGAVRPSAAAAGREADPGPRDVVDDAERLLLHVADDGRAVRGRERQARGGVVHVDEHVPRRQLQRRAAGERHAHGQHAEPRRLALEAGVQDGERGGARRPAHGRGHRLAQRRVHARRQARDHRARVDDRRQAAVLRRRDRERAPADGHPGQGDEVERGVKGARRHGRVRVLPRVVGPDGEVPRRRRRREAVGEGVAEAGRELGEQRELVAREADEPRRAPEEPLVVLAAAVVESGEAAGAEGDGVPAEVADGEGAVAVAGLVDADVGDGAGGRVERGGLELVALRRRARHGGVGAGRPGVVERAGLAVARHHAGRALQPGEGRARVDDHGVGGGRRAKTQLGYVVPHAYGHARRERHGGQGVVEAAAGGLLAERRRAAGRRVVIGGEARGEVGGARIVVAEDGGEGEVGRERRRRAGALRVVQCQVEPRAVPVREIYKKKDCRRLQS